MTQTLVSRPLRDYQQAAIQHTIKAATPGFRGYYTLPTGTGKTRVFTGLVEHYMQHGRVLIVAHRKELIEQAAAAIRNDIPGSDVGIQMGDYNDRGSRITVGSIQTLTPDRLNGMLIERNLFTDVSDMVAVIFDECHHVTVENGYNRLIDQIADEYPDCVFLGCTATPFRADSHVMTDVLKHCTFSRDIPSMIDAGWLCPVTWRPLRIPVDLERVKVTMSQEGKDYNAREVSELFSPQSAFIAESVRDQVETRPTIVFAASVDHSKQLMAAFRAAGCTAEHIDGSLPKHERGTILHAWRRGDIQVVGNFGVLTEGFDYTPIAPNREGLAAVVIARPTMSPALYLQMLGRGTRLKPGTYQDCLVIDVCGNANLLHTKQILLPKTMPTVSEEEIEAFNARGKKPASKPAQKDGQLKKPVAVRINEGVETSWLSWGVREGVYFAEVALNSICVLLPDPADTGLYYPRIITKSENYRSTWRALIDGADTLACCMQHVNLLVARSGNRRLLDKNATWRLKPPSPKQLAQLVPDERQQALEQNWNMGEVSQAISWKFNRTYIEKLQSALKEGATA